MTKDLPNLWPVKASSAVCDFPSSNNAWNKTKHCYLCILKRKKNPEIKLRIKPIFHKLELHAFNRSMRIGTSLKLMYLPARTLQSHGQEGNRWRVQWRIHLTKRHRQAMGPSSSQDLWASIQHHLYGYPCGTRHQLQPLVELNASMGSPLAPLKQLLLINA